MQVILKAVTHPELGEIIINDNLFAVGRHEQPFAAYDAQLVAKLSRRHARIFEQDGVVYITDMGSLNGTSVNGRTVDTLPVRLQRGDQICFTDLCYQIEILGSGAARQPAALPATPPVQLILVPEKQQMKLEPIVVTQFPFLINKASDVFSRYRDSLPEEVSYISRRHAHLFLKGQDLYIEDLGSTNGTFVGGERLEEHARQLHNGDVIAFGGDNFVYRVQLVIAGLEEDNETQQEASKLLTATAHGGEDATRTTFVTSANSFLDIYCIDEDPAEVEDDKRKALRDGGEDATDRSGAGGRWQRVVGKPLLLLREIRGEVGEEKRKSGAGKYWLAALVVVAGVLLWTWLDTAPRREMRALLDSGDYSAAATLANRYLADHPGDPEASQLAGEALLKAVVPEWQSAIESGDFETARLQLDKGMQLAGGHADTRALLEILQWVTRLEAFVAQRGGADAPVTLFRDEQPIRELVAWWDSDAKMHRRSLTTIARHVPEFLDLRAQVFSHVRSLDSQRSLSLAAIDRLTATLQSDLQAGDIAGLHTVLAEFEKKYPRIKGVDKLRTDLDKYASIDADVRARRWVTARRRVGETRFETPVFRAQVETLTQQELPPTDVVRRYYQADDDWQSGATDKALSALETLKSERWGEVAGRRLEHYRKVLDDYQGLLQARGQAGYELQLLAFFRELDPVRDKWFAAALAEEFRVHSDKATAQAERDYTAAHAAWSSYEEKGGIRPLHRLESGVSASYRQLAGLLSDAYVHSNEGLNILAMMDAGHAPEWDALNTRIVNEIRLQRQSLRELAMVLEPSLKQAKLDLLPVLKADKP